MHQLEILYHYLHVLLQYQHLFSELFHFALLMILHCHPLHEYQHQNQNLRMLHKYLMNQNQLLIYLEMSWSPEVDLHSNRCEAFLMLMLHLSLIHISEPTRLLSIGYEGVLF